MGSLSINCDNVDCICWQNEMLNNSALDMKAAVGGEEPWMADFPWAQRDPGGTEMAFCQFCSILVEPGVTNLVNDCIIIHYNHIYWNWKLVLQIRGWSALKASEWMYS